MNRVKPAPTQILRYFYAPFFITAIVCSFIGTLAGSNALLSVIILIIIEVTFSFDNAVVNARVLASFSALWRRLFLTVGIMIAVVGMRMLFPIILIDLTANAGFAETLQLALHQPALYAQKLTAAEPLISAFGGTFLLLLALHFFMVGKERPLWLKRIERPLRRYGRKRVVFIFAVLALTAVVALPGNLYPMLSIEGGVAAFIIFFLIQALESGIERRLKRVESGTVRIVIGWAALFGFIYLELLDASFSLDSVLGAFAVSDNVLIIAAGLGVGAVWARSLTLYMVKRGTLETFIYLEHGAHYAIFVLALSLLVSPFFTVPSAVIGLAGLIIIGASVLSSHRERSRAT